MLTWLPPWRSPWRAFQDLVYAENPPLQKMHTVTCPLLSSPQESPRPYTEYFENQGCSRKRTRKPQDLGFSLGSPSNRQFGTEQVLFLLSLRFLIVHKGNKAEIPAPFRVPGFGGPLRCRIFVLGHHLHSTPHLHLCPLLNHTCPLSDNKSPLIPTFEAGSTPDCLLSLPLSTSHCKVLSPRTSPPRRLTVLRQEWALGLSSKKNSVELTLKARLNCLMSFLLLEEPLYSQFIKYVYYAPTMARP